MGKQTLPPAYNVSPCKILGFTYTHDDLQIDSLADKTSVASGRENMKSKIPKKVNTWLAGLVIHGMFLTC